MNDQNQESILFPMRSVFVGVAAVGAAVGVFHAVGWVTLQLVLLYFGEEHPMPSPASNLWLWLSLGAAGTVGCFLAFFIYGLLGFLGEIAIRRWKGWRAATTETP